MGKIIFHLTIEISQFLNLTTVQTEEAFSFFAINRIGYLKVQTFTILKIIKGYKASGNPADQVAKDHQ